MTLATTLAARRHVSIQFPILVLVALAACSGGEPLSPTTQKPSGYITKVVLTPQVQTTTVHQVVRFTAFAKSSTGDSVPVQVKWSATGGTVDSTGAFSASQPGTYAVIGTLPDASVPPDTATISVLPAIAGLVLKPDSAALQPGGTVGFGVSARLTDGSLAPLDGALFTATGGTITAAGSYTAGTSAGTYNVIAKTGDGAFADTSVVRISAAAPTAVLQAVEITPSAVTLVTGATQRFTVVGRLTDGKTTSVTAPVFGATGGTVTSAGAYTAGSAAGTYRVIVRTSDGVFADTSTVKITLPPITSIALTPSTVTLAAGATQQFSVVGKRSDGSTAAVTATFTATGGTVTGGGAYTAGQSGGSYRIIAVQSGGTLADTSAVTVTATPTLQSISVSPGSATLNPGATQQFAAKGKLSDGSTVTITDAVWTATGGTISASGSYTAGQTTGSYSVKATTKTGSLSAGASVTIVTPAPPPPPPPTGGGNEPAGFARIAEIGFDAMPTGSLWSCSGPGVLAGCWYQTNSLASTQQDGTAPKSPSGVYQYVWPAGLAVGSSAGILGLWSSPNRDEYSQVYESGWFKIPTPDLELPQTVGGMKLLGFWSVGQAALTGQVGNQIAGWINGGGIQSSFTLDIRQQNQVSRSMTQNVNGSALIQAGRWIRYEILMTINDIGVANGTLKVWINGTQTHNYTDVVWRTSSAPSLFFGRMWDPTWGGNGNVPSKTRTDYLWIDHVYISGVR